MARLRARSFALLLILTTAALAGCVGGGTLDGASARDAPENAPSEGGRGDHTVLLRATNGTDGEPIEGAAVVMRWGRDGLALRTDANGEARAHVPADTSLDVSVWRSGFTEERPTPFVTGADGATTRLDVPLYREHVDLHLEGVLSPAAMSGYRMGLSEWDWLDPQEARFSDSAETQREYMRRLVSLEVSLRWVNGPAGGGDLGIGIDPTTQGPSAIEDADEQYMPGEHAEETFLGFAAIYDLGWREADTLHVGPGTGTGYVAPIGLAYTLEVKAHFAGDVDRDRGVPGPGAFAALLAVAVAAVALRRSRR